eukprot:SAG31_NODE_42728_length_270_cov_0.608187_1_plen_23_part_01
MDLTAFFKKLPTKPSEALQPPAT